MDNSVLKIYISSTDKTENELLYEYIVQEARKTGITGATAYRGIMGYGPSSKHIHTSKFWELTEKLPIVIELVDETEKLKSFYKNLENLFNKLPKGCLVTLQPTEVLLHKQGQNK
ncbi:MAG: DUF190 domain-containing protein [Paludibacter sp.]|nr:DUF190 domain-containing protein [Paludibacter sp.]